MTPRNVIQGRQNQGENEKIAYTIDTANWGGTPTGVSFKVYDVTDENKDVTGAVVPINGPIVFGDIITLSAIQNLQAGHLYRVEVTFDNALGNTLECYFEIQGDD